MIKRTLIPLLLMAVLLSACAAAKNNAVREAVPGFSSGSGAPEIMPLPAEPPAAADQSAVIGKTAFASQTQQDLTNRLVIRNANLSIIVDDPAVTMDVITKMANTMGGFVVTSNLYQTIKTNQLKVPEAQVTVRVPAEQLDVALSQIKAQVKDPINDIVYENVSGQDVTQEYTDLQSRLRSLEATSTQLQAILNTATKVSDVLSVYNELRSVNEQIEVLKGQIQYYEQSARLSAISVTIQAKAGVQPVTIGGWEPKGVVKDALQKLIRAYQWLADTVIWIVIFFLPIAIPIGLLLFFLIRGIRKWNQKRKSTKDMVGNKPPAA